jgi:CheY-like chemotaxis protein
MSRTLMLADGSVTIQRVVELTFAHEDIRVTAVSDGRKAIQMLDTEQPDVVLADVDLPEVDGYALAAHMRRVPRLKNIPVLLLRRPGMSAPTASSSSHSSRRSWLRVSRN